LSDEFIKVELTSEQQEDLCARTGISKSSWLLEKHRLAGLALLASSARLDTLPYGPAVVNRVLGLPHAGPSKTEFEIVFTPAQRDQIRDAIGSMFRSITFSADDLDVSFSEEWSGDTGPLEIGRSFVLVTDPAPSPGRLALRLPADRAGKAKTFGTGRHGTTTLALHLLEDHWRPVDKVLDFGTGSGILAIAAAKLGARDVLAIDRDVEAVRVAVDCAALNGLERAIVVRQGDKPPPGARFGLILANLFTSILLAHAGALAAALEPGGTLVATGVARSRGPEVVAAMGGAGLALVEQRELSMWVAFVFRASP
jgi:ribosomal protein L11 methylase PrmA